MVSIIIPTFNEVQTVARTLDALRRVRGDFEVIVVDGESEDGTPAAVDAVMADFPRSLRLLAAPRLRGLQLNRAAGSARGEVFLFLHADALAAPEAVESVEAALQDDSVAGGNFVLAFGGESGWNKFFTWAARVRRWFGLYYGDSGIFVRRDVFERLGGFKPVPVMDDYEFVQRLEGAGRTVCLPSVLLVSDRRWKMQGVFRTLWSWVVVQGLYSLGIPPRRLSRWYPPVRGRAAAVAGTRRTQTTSAG